MRIPREISGSDLAKALRILGYERARQEGSHMRLTTEINGQHHVTIPAHKALKIGTLLNGVLKPVASHHRLSMNQLLEKLDL